MSHVREDLLPIGEFARLCRLSVKRLRHYDAIGLIRPAWVDPATGYRYYRAEQSDTALTIGLLRTLDIDLTSIGDVLTGTNPREPLSRIRVEVEAELARRRRTLSVLDALMDGDRVGAEVDFGTLPARRLAVLHGVATSEDEIGTATSLAVRRLREVLAAGEMPPDARVLAVFPLDFDGPVGLHVGVEAGAGLVPGTDELVLDVGLWASATHVGPYEHIALTVRDLLAAIGSRGHHARGPLVEEYLDDPITTRPESLRTRVSIGTE